MIQEFRARVMSKSALAQAYFPQAKRAAAMRTMQRWIARCRPLAQLLTRSRAHYWTRREVEAIVEYLGEP